MANIDLPGILDLLLPPNRPLGSQRVSRVEHQERIQEFVDGLPYVGKEEVGEEVWCPICFVELEAIFQEYEEWRRNGKEGTEEEGKLLGVTKLAHCGHVYCRKDIIEWVNGYNGSCPTCRHQFLDIAPVSETDDESSDGGEYVPNDEEDDETIDFTDGLSDELERETELSSISEGEHQARREELESQEAHLSVGEEEEEVQGDFEDVESAGSGERSEGMSQEGQPSVVDERDEIDAEDLSAEVLMDVYLSDSSSDIDYEPQDYIMSDTESELDPSDLDLSVEEFESLDQPDERVALYYHSSADSLLEHLQGAAEKDLLSDPECDVDEAP